jgi:hypothetical protein
MGPYAGADCQLSTPSTKGKGWNEEDLSYWLSTFVSVCKFPKQPTVKGRVLRRGSEWVRADYFMSLKDILWSMGYPMPVLTLIPHSSGL